MLLLYPFSCGQRCLVRALGGPRLISANYNIGTPHRSTFIGLVFLRKNTYSECTDQATLAAAERILETFYECDVETLQETKDLLST